MPFIVYTHPRGRSERVFLSGLGAFEHGVPREVDASVVASLLGAVVDGVFERNACFSVHVPAPISETPPVVETVYEPEVEPLSVHQDAQQLPPYAEDEVPNSSRRRRKKE